MTRDSQPSLPAVVRALAVSCGLAALAACAPRAGEEPVAAPAAQPAYEFRGPTVESSPLLYEPGTSGRTPPGGDVDADDAYRSAAEQCNSYARALIDRDQRSSHDRDARRSGQIGSSRTFGLSRTVQSFGDRTAYERHFSSCMGSRGFEPGT